MAWNPGDDPWGLGLMASGAVFGTALLVSLVRRTPGPTWATGLGASAFLVCAGLGAMQPTSTAASSTEAAPEAAAAATPEPTTESPPAKKADEAAAAAEDPPPPPPKENAVPSMPAPPPLPTDATERRAAIRKVLRNARKVYESEKDCKRPEALGPAWAAVAAIPEDARNARTTAVARRLEACRRQARWATSYTVHRDRVAARDAFDETLSKRMKDRHDLSVSIVVSGKDHERIRIGSGGFDDASIGSIADDALLQELADLGFERAVFASPKKSWKHALKPRAESTYVDDALEPYGLHRKLAL